jgi:hypothetical protein
VLLKLHCSKLHWAKVIAAFFNCWLIESIVTQMMHFQVYWYKNVAKNYQVLRQKQSFVLKSLSWHRYLWKLSRFWKIVWRKNIAEYCHPIVDPGVVTPDVLFDCPFLAKVAHWQILVKCLFIQRLISPPPVTCPRRKRRRRRTKIIPGMYALQRGNKW